MATPSAGVTYLHSPDQVLMGGANEARLLAGGNADMLRRFALDSDVRILSHYSDTCVSIYGEGGIAGARKRGADMWVESLRWATQNKPMDKLVGAQLQPMFNLIRAFLGNGIPVPGIGGVDPPTSATVQAQRARVELDRAAKRTLFQLVALRTPHGMLATNTPQILNHLFLKRHKVSDGIMTFLAGLGICLNPRHTERMTASLATVGTREVFLRCGLSPDKLEVDQHISLVIGVDNSECISFPQVLTGKFAKKPKLELEQINFLADKMRDLDVTALEKGCNCVICRNGHCSCVQRGLMCGAFCAKCICCSAFHMRGENVPDDAHVTHPVETFFKDQQLVGVTVDCTNVGFCHSTQLKQYTAQAHQFERRAQT